MSAQLSCTNGHPVAASARFCPVCGVVVACPNGHAVSVAEAAFCPECGASLSAVSEPRPAASGSPEAAAADPVRTPVAEAVRTPRAAAETPQGPVPDLPPPQRAGRARRWSLTAPQSVLAAAGALAIGGAALASGLLLDESPEGAPGPGGVQAADSALRLPPAGEPARGAPDLEHTRAVEFILDASGSMNETVDGRPKLAMAQAVFRTLLDAEEDASLVGLRAFGRVAGLSEAASCQDSELLVPVAESGATAAAAAVGGVTANGMTPIAESLSRAAEDFLFEPGRLNTIVLLSDGEESCGGDPAAVVRDLRARGFEITVHVVALDVDAGARAQLSAIAAAGGGVYWDARSEDDLRRALADVTERSLRVVAPPATAQPSRTAAAARGTASPDGSYTALFETTAGNFSVELFPASAPETVGSFVSLARAGFYDGQDFYRVSKGFVIATGDPTKTGGGDAGYGTGLEPSKLRNTRGTLSVGIRPDSGTVGSQFFVNLADNAHLDFDNGQAAQYYPFGRVTDGMEVVDAIGNGAVTTGDRPVSPVVIIRVTIVESTGTEATPTAGARTATPTARARTATPTATLPPAPTAAPTSPPVVNLAVNGGFESGGLGAPWGTGIYEPRPQGVFWGVADAEAAVVTDVVHSGSYALRIVNRSPSGPNIYRTLSQKVSVTGGAPHCLTFWERVQNGSGGMLTFRLNDSWSSAIGIGTGSGGAWLQHAYTFTAEDGNIDLRMVSENTGTAWIDDIVLTAGACAVPNGAVPAGASPR